MPPWLTALLLKHGSSGLVDSLSQIAGVQPNFAQLPDRQVTQDGKTTSLQGKYSVDAQGKPVIGLTPDLINNFGADREAGYGTSKTPLPAKTGDAVLEHEFGHAAAYNGLAGQLGALDPNAETSEPMADRFQNAFQFLRSHKTDMSGLDDSTKMVARVILAHPLMKDHPINKQKDALLWLLDFMRKQ